MGKHAFGWLNSEHILAAVQSGDEGVALESCEFWSAFCEAAVSQPETLSPDVLRPFLGRLVPVLLKNMVRASWWACHWMGMPCVPGHHQ